MNSSRQRAFSRRTWLQSTALAAAGAILEPWMIAAPAAERPQNPKPLLPLNRFPRMVQEYFVEQLREFARKNHETKARLKTKPDAEAYVRSVREKILSCFGPFSEKTPLNARITGELQRDSYSIQKIIFESRPGFFVTGNLYLPKNRSVPLPAVLGTCGHSNGGKSEPAYQSFSQGLARLGYIVFIIDPLGQGERLQYPDGQGKSKIGVGVMEHLYAGNPQFLIGEFLGAWRAWDAIRALDYLLSRTEVDPRHVGVTGNSGGGTMTTWLCGVEPRFTMAAPGCFVTSFQRNLENELPADTEQCPPRVLSLGLDHEDFIAALAPKPVILLAKQKDYFDIRGTEAAYRRLKQLYALLGAAENIAMFAGPTSHGYTQENREAMYRWFNRVTGVSSQSTEPPLTLEKEETLSCTTHGQVSELNSRTIYSFTAARSKELAAARQTLTRDQLIQKVSALLKLPRRTETPDYRILRSRGRNYPLPRATCYAVETEPGLHALVYRLGTEPLEARPPLGPARAVLYVSHQSADAELRDEPLVRELISTEGKAVFYACDLRGIGESRPDTCGENSYLDPYGSDYFYAIHSIMLDKPYVGQRTHDLACVIQWLANAGHREIHLAAKGWGTLPAVFAALLSDAVVQVTLKDSLDSYALIAESEKYSWPLSSFVPGVLKEFDLPDCYRQLEEKKLRRIV